jgi:putative FmdB family regulatory protein
MPLYDYRCTECAREIEVMHGIDGAGPTACEHCGGAMRKALSAPAIHFKGSGWAKKDAASAVKAKPASGTADSSSETKTEADTAAGKGPAETPTSDGGSAKAASKATSTTGSTTD